MQDINFMPIPLLNTIPVYL